MPRLTHSLPRYRKHRASGQAVVTLGGVDHYLGRHGTKASRTHYDRLVAEWLAAGRSSAAPTDAPLTIVELCSRYLAFAKDHYQKNGRCTRVVPGVKAAIKYLRTWYGKDPADSFGPVALKALRQRMVDDGHSRAEAHAARVTPLSCGSRPGSNRKRRPKRSAGGKYAVDSYRRAIHRACDKAGVERWSPNRLRHAAGTEVRSKFGLEAAQVILGHASADVTQVYAERDAEKGAEVARLIG